MLTIRMQRTGRKGHAMFRVVVQDARVTPTSGKVVASIGHYDPHTKATVIAKDKAAFYLEHGAQPSDRVAKLLKAEGVKLPKWVELETKKAGTLRHADKLRKNRPTEAQAPAEEPIESPEAEVTEPEPTTPEASNEPESEVAEKTAEDTTSDA
jgi:small subunit ribosomal protein S16